LALVTFLGSASVSAQEPLIAALDYEQSGKVDACPDEAAFQAAVVERLGRDPFVTAASRKIVVRLSGGGSSWTALVRVEENGVAIGERRIEAKAGCDELAAGAALAVSIAIDPLVALGGAAPDARRSVAETKPDVPAPAPVAAPEKRPAEREAVRADGVWFTRVAARAWIGAVPGLSAGPSLGLGYRAETWSLAVDGFGVLPRSASVAGSERAVSASLWGAELVPCLEHQHVRGCAVFALARLLADGHGVDVPLSDASWQASAGASFGYSFVGGRWSLTPLIEGAARLQSIELSLEDKPAWSTPRVMAALGIELAYAL
jgi:hypothetical protein